MKKTISGIRGVVGADLTLRDILFFADNFAEMAGPSCIIGMDTRPTSDIIKRVAGAALRQNGIDVKDLGVAPTPVVFWESRRTGSGLVVTASHNPTEWNGLKFVTEGRGINERELGTILQNHPRRAPKIGRHDSIQSDYIESARRLIGEFDSSPDIIVDAGGGAAAGVAPALLEGSGCKVHTINSEAGKSSRGPDPTSDDLDELTALSKNADIGFAYDYDGDRLVIVKDGKKQPPDATLALGVAKAIRLGYKRFVLSVDSSVAVERYILNNGGTVVRSRVGEANVIDDILKSGAQAGGEGSSGGFILPEFNYCRDGLLTGGLVASMDGSEVDEILELVSSYTQIRRKVAVAPELHENIISDIASGMQKDYQTDTIDGLRVIVDEHTWALVRASNTEDIIRISTESNDAARARKLHDDITRMVRHESG